MLLKEKISNKRIVIDLKGIIELDDDKLFELCMKNKDIRFERMPEGELIVMLPVGSEGSARESIIILRIGIWNDKYKLGKVFSSSGGFTLPDGAMRSPDVAFINTERWKALPLLKRKKFAPICPDFVAELRSESDNLQDLKEKMNEWITNGCRLAWLIDPLEEKAYIYRANSDINTIDSFNEKLFGEDVLPNFVLDLKEFREEE